MVDVAAAREFLDRTARLVEVRLFEALFDAAPREPVVAALAAYANDDGGLGHALDPDVRAPTSQPVAIGFGLRVLATIGEVPEPLVRRCCEFLDRVATAAGAVAAADASFLDYPRAAHWGDEVPQPGLFPTVGIAASLHELSYLHPWLERATAFCLAELDARPPHEAHRLRFALKLVDALGDEERFRLVAAAIPRATAFRADPASPRYGVSPIELAVTARRAHRLFPRDVIDAHLDALERDQQPDGGWPVRWDPGSEESYRDWRGYVTVEAVRLLREHDRL